MNQKWVGMGPLGACMHPLMTGAINLDDVRFIVTTTPLRSEKERQMLLKGYQETMASIA